ncbi:MAG: glutamine amidotransferase [Geopsychrobacter sp.]|nr:glutamine amidotransferase [Geopsychrobacter sp.]
MAQRFGDFEDWIIAASGEAPGLFMVADGIDEPLPSLEKLSALIITGSHRMVSEGGAQVELWSRFIRDAVDTRLPVLGICDGHQLLSRALGGVVSDHPDGLELGQVEVEMESAAQDDPLFKVLPRFCSAYATHLQSISTLPAGSFVYGHNSFEPNHAVRFAPTAWGVQFHPEFTQAILQGYIRHQRKRLSSDAQMTTLIDRVKPLPEAGQLIQHFCQLADCQNRSPAHL